MIFFTRTIYVNVDSPNLGLPYFVGGGHVHDDHNVDSYGIDAEDTDDDVQTTCVYFVKPSHTQKEQIADLTLPFPEEEKLLRINNEDGVTARH